MYVHMHAHYIPNGILSGLIKLETPITYGMMDA